MNLKGHTKIELFNAETGELEQEVHEDNMITNAISRALNPPIDFLIKGVSINTILGNIMPIQSVGMGGIMLFKDNITESKDTISLPKDNDVIGYAGDTYSGTNVYRGTYNLNESKALSNGYRHVWDFATDRACGDISCVCLTHKMGGNAGNRYNSADNVLTSLSIGTVVGEGRDNIEGYAIGMVDKGLYCFVAVTSTNTVTLSYYEGFNSDKITLSKAVDQKATTLVDKVTITLSNANLYTNLGSNKFYVDKNGVLTMAKANNYIISYCHINILTKTLIDEGNVTINVDSITQNGFTTYGLGFYALLGEYFLLKAQVSSTSPDYNASSPYTYIALDKNGDFLKRVTTDSWNSDYINPYVYYNEKIDAIELQSDGLWIDTSLNLTRNYVRYSNNETSIGWYLYSYIDIYPYFLRVYTNYAIGLIELSLDRTYLASINNLATTVTKTNKQTMKITYDITET